MQREQTVLVVVDVQQKLSAVMHERERLLRNLGRAILGLKALSVPILVMEQVPEKLGPTEPALTELLDPAMPRLAKQTFSCCGAEAFTDTLRELNRRTVLLAGIEAHVCVYQTAMDLLAQGYAVWVLGDAVSSRDARDADMILQQMRANGIRVIPTETALFALLRHIGDPAFRAVQQAVKHCPVSLTGFDLKQHALQATGLPEVGGVLRHGRGACRAAHEQVRGQQGPGFSPGPALFPDRPCQVLLHSSLP